MEKSSGSGDGRENANSNATTPKDTIATATTNEQDVNPFEEYMWMGDPKEEDEVNLQAMEEIIEDEFIESCFEDMLEEEALGLFSPPNDEHDNHDNDDNDDTIPSLQNLSLDSGADGVDEGSAEDSEATWKQDDATPSGFGGQSSESENSDSDSLGNAPQR